MFYRAFLSCLGKDIKLKVVPAAQHGGMRESLCIDRIVARAACRILLQPAVAMQHQHSCSPRCLAASGSHYQLPTTMLQLSASHHPHTTLRTSWTSIQYFIWGFKNKWSNLYFDKNLRPTQSCRMSRLILKFTNHPLPSEERISNTQKKIV